MARTKNMGERWQNGEMLDRASSRFVADEEEPTRRYRPGEGRERRTQTARYGWVEIGGPPRGAAKQPAQNGYAVMTSPVVLRARCAPPLFLVPVAEALEAIALTERKADGALL